MITCGMLITMLLLSEFASFILVQHTQASPGFLANFSLKLYIMASGALAAASTPQLITAGAIAAITLAVVIHYDDSGVIVQFVKDTLEGHGFVGGVLKVIKKGYVQKIVNLAVKAFSVTEYRVPIESMSEEGEWEFQFSGTAYEGGVGGVVVPVDKVGLLAPYIGLASTIIVATIATAIYVKRVKRRKEKQ